MKLVSFHTGDNLKLKGLFAAAENGIATIIHIHGNSGNFYENDFIPIMIEKYNAAGINFFCFNNRGHDVIAEAYQNSKLVYIGGAYELLEHCIYDIEAAIQFAQGIGSKVILQGHSFGCLKILVYLLKTGKQLDFILLSPSDTYGLQLNHIQPETVPHQLRRIKRKYSKSLASLLPDKEFGIRQSGVEYFIPISAHSFITLFEGSLVKILRYDEPLKYYIKTKGFVYTGGKDALRTERSEKIEQIFRERVQDLHFAYYEDGDHHFHNYEVAVINEIIEWVHQG